MILKIGNNESCTILDNVIRVNYCRDNAMLEAHISIPVTGMNPSGVRCESFELDTDAYLMNCDGDIFQTFLKAKA